MNHTNFQSTSFLKYSCSTVHLDITKLLCHVHFSHFTTATKVLSCRYTFVPLHVHFHIASFHRCVHVLREMLSTRRVMNEGFEA